jgi:hypothetical protein
MPAKRADALRQLGFAMRLLDDTWETRFRQATAFAAAHAGSLEVKRGCAERPKLAGWVARQRALFAMLGSVQHATCWKNGCSGRVRNMLASARRRAVDVTWRGGGGGGRRARACY